MRFLAFTLIWVAGVCSAEERPVFLETLAGDRLHIADVRLVADGSYEVDYSETAFTDHFLSMRPFRCLEGPGKHWCHVPYPYEIMRDVSEDYVDLEYDFLFIWKAATEYGIDTWNGVYYVLAEEGEALRGIMHEVDMGTLGIPPEAGNLRPLKAKDLHLAEPESHWLPFLTVGPAGGS